MGSSSGSFVLSFNRFIRLFLLLTRKYGCFLAIQRVDIHSKITITKLIIDESIKRVCTDNYKPGRMRRPIVCMQIASRSVILIKQSRFPGCRECSLSETFTDLYFLVASYTAEAAIPRSRGHDKRFVKPFCYSILRFRYPSYLRYHKSYRDNIPDSQQCLLVIDLTGLRIIFSQQRSSLWIELHEWNIFDFSSFLHILSFDITFCFLTLSLRMASPPRHFR